MIITRISPYLQIDMDLRRDYNITFCTVLTELPDVNDVLCSVRGLGGCVIRILSYLCPLSVLKPNQSQNTNWPFDVLHRIDLCRSDFLFLNTKLDVRRAGMWPSSRSAVKPANTPVTSPAANHVHFYVQNPTADSTAWSREKPF